MGTKTIWISVSIFSKQKNWNFILINGIKPIMGNFIQTGNVIKYAVEFNYLRGSNIRLSILANKSNIKKFITSLNAHLKSFLLNNNMLVEMPTLPVNGIFMPYPFNTIQYGLHSPDILNKVGVNGKELVSLGNEQYSFYQVLSEIIIEALREEEIDDELIVTFSFYLHLILMNCVCMKFSVNHHIFSSSYDLFQNVDNELLSKDFLVQKFSENMEVLKEIKSDAFHNGRSVLVESPAWIKKWEITCLSEIGRQEKAELVRNDSSIIYFNIVESINRILGVKKNMKQLLYYFIFNTMFENKSIPV